MNFEFDIIDIRDDSPACPRNSKTSGELASTIKKPQGRINKAKEHLNYAVLYSPPPVLADCTDQVSFLKRKLS
jgi:hypothetical protein